MHPFRQTKEGSVIRRTFSEGVDSADLVWHRDRSGRIVTVIESHGWHLQFDGGLPIPLVEGSTYSIPARSWHRVIKGTGQLRIVISEGDMPMELTESQLRRIVREEILREMHSLEEAKSRKYGGKEYKSSPGSVAAIKKHGGSASKAVKAGAFDWADDPMAAAQAAHIVAIGEPTVAKGTKRKKK